MRNLCFIFLCVCFASTTQAQENVIKGFKDDLAKATTTEKKVEVLGNLSRTMMNIDLAEADKYGMQMIEEAEMSRDRKLMVKALLTNGERYSYLAGRKDNIEKSISYYTQGLELAKKNKLDEYIVKAYISLSEINRYLPDADKALDYCNQAYSYTSSLKNDSISARVHMEYGSVYILKNEKILALKNYMTLIRLAEDAKNANLLRGGYISLSEFYAVLEDYDKAIDYRVKALDKLSEIKTGQTPYSKVQDLARIGDLYMAKKSHEMAMTYFEKSLSLADSLKFEPIKAIAYRSIINNYLASNEPQKALDYFNNQPQLKKFLQAVNFGHFVDQSYGYIYTQIGNYDSAKYYYNKVAPFFENDVSISNQYSYYSQLGKLYKKTKEYDKSLGYFLKAKTLADAIGEMETMSLIAVELDTLYRIKGDYKQALYYTSLNYTYKDSLDKLGKAKDLLQIEVADEQQRQERLDREKAESKRKRYNIQYMLITIGISGLFVLMVMMGMFKVSATTIKMIGFFTFLMFFEFIFLIFKKNIYTITNGEPWKDLAFMILLAAILLPLHHWLEHKVIHYLTSHNRLTASGEGIMKRVLKRNKKVNEVSDEA